MEFIENDDGIYEIYFGQNLVAKLYPYLYSLKTVGMWSLTFDDIVEIKNFHDTLNIPKNDNIPLTNK